MRNPAKHGCGPVRFKMERNYLAVISRRYIIDMLEKGAGASGMRSSGH